MRASALFEREVCVINNILSPFQGYTARSKPLFGVLVRFDGDSTRGRGDQSSGCSDFTLVVESLDRFMRCPKALIACGIRAFIPVVAGKVLIVFRIIL